MLVYYYDCCGRSMAVEIMAAKHVRDSRDVFVIFLIFAFRGGREAT